MGHSASTPKKVESQKKNINIASAIVKGLQQSQKIIAKQEQNKSISLNASESLKNLNQSKNFEVQGAKNDTEPDENQNCNSPGSSSPYQERIRPKQKSWFYYEELMKSQQRQEEEYNEAQLNGSIRKKSNSYHPFPVNEQAERKSIEPYRIKEENTIKVRDFSKQKSKLINVDLIEFCKYGYMSPRRIKLKSTLNFAGQIRNLVSLTQDKQERTLLIKKRETSPNQLEVSSIPKKQSARKLLTLPKEVNKNFTPKHKNTKTFTTNLLDILRNPKPILGSQIVEKPYINSHSLSHSKEQEQNSFTKSCQDLLKEMNMQKQKIAKRTIEEQEKFYQKRIQCDLIRSLTAKTSKVVTPEKNLIISNFTAALQQQEPPTPPPLNFDYINQPDQIQESVLYCQNNLLDSPISSSFYDQTIKNLQKELIKPSNKQYLQLPDLNSPLAASNENLMTFNQLSPARSKRSYQPSMSNPTAQFAITQSSMQMTPQNDTVLYTSQLEKSVTDKGDIQLNNYILKETLGSGSFGKVLLSVDSKTLKKFAIKVMKKSCLKKKLLTLKVNSFTLLDREIAILKKMNHPNIVKLFEVIDNPEKNKIYLVMEYLQKGALLSKTFFKNTSTILNAIETPRNQKSLKEEQVWHYFRQFLCGLDYLHNQVNIIHRDIKPENLLVDELDNLKIGDFGVAHLTNTREDQINKQIGTVAYFAPEMFNGGICKGRQLDIWASGVTLFQMATGRLPFGGTNLHEIKESVVNNVINFPESMSFELRNFISWILTIDPEKRPNVQDLMKHQWITKKGLHRLQNIITGEVEVNEMEIQNAMTKIKVGFALNSASKLLFKAKKARQSLKEKVLAQQYQI